MSTEQERLHREVLISLNKLANYKEKRKCCLTCMTFDKEKEFCMTYAAKPPLHVLTYGCPTYTDIDEDIPF